MRSWQNYLFGVAGVLAALVVVMHFRAQRQREDEQDYLTTQKQTITVSSGSFPPKGDLPINCTCKGKEVSPSLTWEGNRSDTGTYVVLMTDYDVPTAAFPVFNLSHWVVYNLPASVRSLPEGVTTEQMRMLGGKFGKNSPGNQTYIGPCPPVGRHAYVFRVYALDESLSFDIVPDKQAVLDAMKGHILGYGELIGYFQ